MSNCTKHTEHASRGFQPVGRYFNPGGPEEGVWETCFEAIEQVDIPDLALRVHDLIVSPALSDLVRLDPAFPQDYQDTFSMVLDVLFELQLRREEAS